MNLDSSEIQEIKKLIGLARFESIKSLVTIKVKELQEYKQARFGNEEGEQITRHSYETLEITNYLHNNNFSVNMVFAYLTVLKTEIINNHIKIIEYRPHIDYDGTQDFLNWIDREIIMIQLKQKEQQGVINENQHPKIFENGAFDIFAKWVKHSKDEQVKSISFIFQKLKKENKLRNTTFKVLSEWAFNNNYLNEESYNELLTNGCFISPSKVLTKTRLALYNSIIGN